MILKITLAVSGIVAAHASCTQAQSQALLADIQKVVASIDASKYPDSASYLTAVNAVATWLNYPCASCSTGFLQGVYDGYGTATSPCRVNAASTECKTVTDNAASAYLTCSTGTKSGAAETCVTAAAALILASLAL